MIIYILQHKFNYKHGSPLVTIKLNYYTIFNKNGTLIFLFLFIISQNNNRTFVYTNTFFNFFLINFIFKKNIFVGIDTLLQKCRLDKNDEIYKEYEFDKIILDKKYDSKNYNSFSKYILCKFDNTKDFFLVMMIFLFI